MGVMTTATKQTSGAASRARSAMERSTELWKQNAYSFSDQTRRFPNMIEIDLIPAAERYFDFVRRTVDINRKFTIRWLETANTLSAAAAEQVESVGTLVRDQADSAHRVAQAEAKKAEEVEEDLVREARKLERQRATQAHEMAAERYESMTKAELSDLLAERGLPKTGNVDELIERLIEADVK
jgi:hypothetical protein